MGGKTGSAFCIIEQGLTNCNPRPGAGFLSKFYWNTALSFVYMLSMVAFMLNSTIAESIFVAGNLCRQSLKYLAPGPVRKCLLTCAIGDGKM